MPSKSVFCLAGQNGHIDVIAALCDAGRDRFLSLDGAIAGGQLPVVQFLRSRYPLLNFNRMYLRTGLAAGHVHVAEWLLSDKALWRHHAFAEIQSDAAEFGHLDLLIFAADRAIGAPLSQAAFVAAAANGHLHVLRWMHARGWPDAPFVFVPSLFLDPRQDAPEAVAPAASVALPPFSTSLAFDSAAANGHIDVVHWIKRHTALPHSPAAAGAAAANGHYETYRFCVDRLGIVPDPRDLASAARHGHFFIVEHYVLSFVRGDRPAPPPLPSGAAAVPLVQTDSLMPDAALPATPLVTLDHINVMLAAALAGGHIFLADWLVANARATPMPAMMSPIAVTACTESARWLHRRLVRAAVISTAASTQCLSASDDSDDSETDSRVQIPYSVKAIERACETSALDMIRFLAQTCRIPVSDRAITTAVRHGHLDVVKLLFALTARRPTAPPSPPASAGSLSPSSLSPASPPFRSSPTPSSPDAAATAAEPVAIAVPERDWSRFVAIASRYGHTPVALWLSDKLADIQDHQQRLRQQKMEEMQQMYRRDHGSLALRHHEQDNLFHHNHNSLDLQIPLQHLQHPHLPRHILPPLHRLLPPSGAPAAAPAPTAPAAPLLSAGFAPINPPAFSVSTDIVNGSNYSRNVHGSLNDNGDRRTRARH